MKNNKIYFIVNPEGKTFEETADFNEEKCKQKFVQQWVLGSTWNFQMDSYELGVIWGVFGKRGFKCLSVNMPELKEQQK